MGTLDGKVCVVTGAAGAIGRETVGVLTGEGATVAAVDVKGGVGAEFFTADLTDPEVEAISFRTPGGVEVLPNFIRGPVQLIAEAYDTPAVAVPGEWAGMPIAPSLLTWRIENLGGKVVVKEQVGIDFRTTIPPNPQFWRYYARGTYQNCCVFGPHYSFRQPGCFLFKLTRTPFDTKSIPDGVYDLVVTAMDMRGNQGFRSRRFTVHNRPGWVGS